MARFTDSSSTTLALGAGGAGTCSSTVYIGAGKRNSVEFITPGCCAWTSTFTGTATFEIWGGGGSGAARCCCDCGHDGHNGAGGGFVSYTANITAGEVYTICIGCGGFKSIDACNHNCCLGQAGQTSFVTGPAFTSAGATVCATGGAGGNNSCLYGGTIALGGCGVVVGGSNTASYSANTPPSGWTSYNTPCYCWNNRSMSAPPHGTNHQTNINADWWFHTAVDGSNAGGGFPGQFPGGGGATPKMFQSCGCRQGGTGGNGLVRIKW
jgi:hypothetical protein